ncbi:hypothetical protein E3P96_00017 [Wallemia ichthyophaga]|nr:hypothetical protein E3P96_00017 [Wallemia ichthyophaga]
MESIPCSYTTLPPLSNSLEWTQAFISLNSKLNLKDIAYDGHLIPMLDVSLTLFDQASFNKPKSLIPSSVIDTPFVHLLFLQCEDNEYYKSTLKPKIREWLQTISSHKRQEWVIVLMSSSSQNKTNNIFKIKSGVIDKIRMDFNYDKRDRCVQISRIGVNGIEDPNCWNPLFDKLKEAIVAGFDLNINSRFADVERSESQRNLPGWNFCTFFILKESLALSYIGLNLFQEAQLVYEQLEQLFHQSLDNNTVINQFIDSGGKEIHDDSGDLLSTTKKPYRQMILSNSISVFDFRLYLFACQCNIAGEHLGNVELVAQRSINFINMFSHSLQPKLADLRPYFVQYWKFVASLTTIYQCDRWFTEEHKVNDVNRAHQYSLRKAELYDIAIDQLQDLSIRFGILPNKYPFAQDKYIKVHVDEIPQTTHKQLRQALSSRREFDKLFIHLCSSAARYYRQVAKFKKAWSLDLLVAGLNMERGHYESSLRFFELLNASEARSMWYSTRMYALLGQLLSHAHLDRVRDERWADAALDLVQIASTLDATERGMSAAMVDQMGGGGVGSSATWGGFEWLLRELKIFAQHAHKSFDIPLSPSLRVSFSSVRPDVVFSDDDDGSSIDARIDSNLPCSLVADAVVFTFHSLRHRHGIEYRCDSVRLEPGHNAVKAFCSTPAHDIFFLGAVNVLASGISFLEHIPVSEGRRRCCLNIPFDARALAVKLERPDNVVVGSGALHLKMKAGRKKMDAATVRLTSPHLVFGYVDSELVDDTDNCSLERNPESVILRNLDTQTWCTVAIPYHVFQDTDVATVNVQVDYTSDARPHQLVKTLAYDLVNPLKLHVSHTQMSDITILSADVAASAGYNVRVKDVRLVSTQHSHHSHSHSADPFILAAGEKASYGFTIKSDECSDLGLLAEYGTIENGGLCPGYAEISVDFAIEVYNMSYEIVQHELNAHQLKHHAQWVSKFITAHHTWSHSSGYEFKQVDENALDDALKTFAFTEGEKLALRGVIVGAIERLPSHPIESRHWDNCTLPIKLPIAEIVASGSINFKQHTLRLGEAALVSILLSTSGAADGEVLHYELDTPLDEWLISGKARGEYKVVTDKPFIFTITLLPIKMGAITPPRLKVFSRAGRTVSTFIENELQRIVVFSKTRSEHTFSIEMPRRELLDWAREREKNNKLLSYHAGMTFQGH